MFIKLLKYLFIVFFSRLPRSFFDADSLTLITLIMVHGCIGYEQMKTVFYSRIGENHLNRFYRWAIGIMFVFQCTGLYFAHFYHLKIVGNL